MKITQNCGDMRRCLQVSNLALENFKSSKHKTKNKIIGHKEVLEAYDSLLKTQTKKSLGLLSKIEMYTLFSCIFLNLKTQINFLNSDRVFETLITLPEILEEWIIDKSYYLETLLRLHEFGLILYDINKKSILVQIYPDEFVDEISQSEKYKALF